MRRPARLRLRNLEPRDVPSSVVEVEPNNTAAAANTVPIALGDVLTTAPDDWLTVIGDVGSNVDRDYFRFTLTSPAGVFLNLDSRDVGLSTTLDAVLDVFDATGVTTFGHNDDGYDFENWATPVASVPSATSPDASLYVDLPAGTYVARVAASGPVVTGNYRLRMLADPAQATAPPALNSRAGAPVSLFLDFDGHAATDDWGTYSALPFDMSGAGGTFTAAERLAVRNVWRVVAEDFAPFDVNVTTVEPASANFRVVVTANAGSIVGAAANARGAALAGSFAGAGTNTGFVFRPGFSDYQGGVSGAVVAAGLEMGNEVSRDLGVALGLRNYGGVHSHPNGIMQIPDTGLNRATWSVGLTHSGEPPVIAQDDMVVIASPANGITLMPDDVGDTPAKAVVLVAGGGTGVIADNVADRDVFAFTAIQGNATVVVATDPYAGNLNAAVRLLNGAGEVLIADDPDGTFDAGVGAYLPSAGTYFIEVRSHGGPGEVGAYRVTASVAPVTGPGQVESTVINGGAAQRSMVTGIVVRFTRPMTFPNGVNAAIRVTSAAGLANVSIDLSGSTPSQTIAKLSFPNGAGGFGSIPDGRYTLSIISSEAFDDTGIPLDGNSDGIGGGDYQFGFTRLFGDVDGNGGVDVLDFGAFRQAFGTVFAALDFDLNGVVDALDFGQFRPRFGTSV